MNNRINIQTFLGNFPKNCYSDYEELAFLDSKRVWVEQLFKSVQDIGKAFSRDRDNPKDFMDLVFFNSVHLLSSFVEVHGRVSKRMVDNVVESVCYTIDTLMTNDEVVRSSIDWNNPDAYTEWVQMS